MLGGAERAGAAAALSRKAAIAPRAMPIASSPSTIAANLAPPAAAKVPSLNGVPFMRPSRVQDFRRS